ncbi:MULTISPECIES: DNA cytosine methyltransferase [unclassified Synechocystis]|uniref:DNA cytosine methyltransferase n=1 Tax=unclassified Synechocystis TaxID=2640012 RepID=UPI000417843D|nr:MULTISPECIES: DNA cytosine methyltransferase [unclassified Synechocystis]AIE73621.1 DNA-cytosine methyltransferase [Synechocystis sp. PCC 6714]MCT0254980.1 DNA cytosine methyltransferase [Synechocystis sp. CS-94]
MARPIAIDLFAGCGGMSLGLEAAGFDIVAAVEFDAVHCLVHHHNFPYGVTICRDIALVTAGEILRKLNNKGYSNDIDLIAGGPPCQGFSLMGKRQLDDPRNSLVFEYVRMIRDIKPKYFLFENVPGIQSGKHKKFLEELISEFETIGYHIEKPILVMDASLYGAPQKRKRLIILGSRKDVKPVTYPLPFHFDLAELKQNNCSGKLISNIACKPLFTCGEAIDDLIKHTPYLVGEDLGISADLLDYSALRKSYAINANGAFSLCHKRRVNNLVYGHIGSQHTEKSIKRFADTIPGTVEKTSRFLRLSKTGLCNTLRAGTASDKGAYTAPRPIHYALPRCITIREAARLHTYPDWFQFHNTIWHGFREIGNSVVPLLAKALGEEIRAALNCSVEDLPVYNLDRQDRALLHYNLPQASRYLSVER